MSTMLTDSAAQVFFPQAFFWTFEIYNQINVSNLVKDLLPPKERERKVRRQSVQGNLIQDPLFLNK